MIAYIFKYLKNIFARRELILALLVRGFKAKYKNSFLGIFWSLLNPLLNVAIFAFIFTAIIKIDIKNYPLYLLCAIFPWNFFNSALINSVVSIYEDSHFVKNTFFPIEIIPLSVVIVNLANYLIDILILALVLFLSGHGNVLFFVYVPILVFIEFILIVGVSIFLAGSYIIFRDLNFILNLFLRLFFYFVPVIYSLELVPVNLRFWYLLNPMAIIIDAFVKVSLYGAVPDLNLLAIAFAESMFIFILGLSIFGKIKKMIPERL